MATTLTHDDSHCTACELPSDLPMVWITQGKTDHAAYILKIENDGRRLVKWIASELTQWVPADAIVKTELPKRRRRRPTKTQNDFYFPGVAKNSAASKDKASANDQSRSKQNKKRPRKQKEEGTAVAKAPQVAQKDEEEIKEESSPISKPKSAPLASENPPDIMGEKKYPVGTKVYKEFPPFGWFSGRVVGHTQRWWYQVQYEDDDSEEMTEKELEKIVVRDSDDEDENSSQPIFPQQTAGEATAPEGAFRHQNGRSTPRRESSLRPKMTILPRRDSLLSTASGPKRDSPSDDSDDEMDTPIALMAQKKRMLNTKDSNTKKKPCVEGRLVPDSNTDRTNSLNFSLSSRQVKTTTAVSSEPSKAKSKPENSRPVDAKKAESPVKTSTSNPQQKPEPETAAVPKIGSHEGNAALKGEKSQSMQGRKEGKKQFSVVTDVETSDGLPLPRVAQKPHARKDAPVAKSLIEPPSSNASQVKPAAAESKASSQPATTEKATPKPTLPKLTPTEIDADQNHKGTIEVAPKKAASDVVSKDVPKTEKIASKLSTAKSAPKEGNKSSSDQNQNVIIEVAPKKAASNIVSKDIPKTEKVAAKLSTAKSAPKEGNKSSPDQNQKVIVKVAPKKAASDVISKDIPKTEKVASKISIAKSTTKGSDKSPSDQNQEAIVKVAPKKAASDVISKDAPKTEKVASKSSIAKSTTKESNKSPSDQNQEDIVKVAPKKAASDVISKDAPKAEKVASKPSIAKSAPKEGNKSSTDQNQKAIVKVAQKKAAKNMVSKDVPVAPNATAVVPGSVQRSEKRPQPVSKVGPKETAMAKPGNDLSLEKNTTVKNGSIGKMEKERGQQSGTRSEGPTEKTQRIVEEMKTTAAMELAPLVGIEIKDCQATRETKEAGSADDADQQDNTGDVNRHPEPKNVEPSKRQTPAEAQQKATSQPTTSEKDERGEVKVQTDENSKSRKKVCKDSKNAHQIQHAADEAFEPGNLIEEPLDKAQNPDKNLDATKETSLPLGNNGPSTQKLESQKGTERAVDKCRTKPRHETTKAMPPNNDPGSSAKEIPRKQDQEKEKLRREETRDQKHEFTRQDGAKSLETKEKKELIGTQAKTLPSIPQSTISKDTGSLNLAVQATVGRTEEKKIAKAGSNEPSKASVVTGRGKENMPMDKEPLQSVMVEIKTSSGITTTETVAPRKANKDENNRHEDKTATTPGDSNKAGNKAVVTATIVKSKAVKAADKGQTSKPDMDQSSVGSAGKKAQEMIEGKLTKTTTAEPRGDKASAETSSNAVVDLKKKVDEISSSNFNRGSNELAAKLATVLTEAKEAEEKPTKDVGKGAEIGATETKKVVAMATTTTTVERALKDGSEKEATIIAGKDLNTNASTTASETSKEIGPTAKEVDHAQKAVGLVPKEIASKDLGTASQRAQVALKPHLSAKSNQETPHNIGEAPTLCSLPGEKEVTQEKIVGLVAVSSTPQLQASNLLPSASRPANKRAPPPSPPARKSRRIALKKDKRDREAREEAENEEEEEVRGQKAADSKQNKVQISDGFQAENKQQELQEEKRFSGEYSSDAEDEEGSAVSAHSLSNASHDVEGEDPDFSAETVATCQATEDVEMTEREEEPPLDEEPPRAEEPPRDEAELDLAATLVSMQSMFAATTSKCAAAPQEPGSKPVASNNDSGVAFSGNTSEARVVPTEETCCTVCGRHIAALAAYPVDWSRPLHYPTDKAAIDAINEHTTNFHSQSPVWNVLEAKYKLQFESVQHSTAPNPITPVAYVKLALRHAVCSSYSIDENLLDMGKLRDLFVRRLGIARGFIRWSSDSFLEGRTFTNCGGVPVTNAELRQSSLLLLAYLEEHVLEHAFEKNFQKTKELAKSMPFLRWRNAVQCVFLDPNGVENAWFMEGTK